MTEAIAFINNLKQGARPQMEAFVEKLGPITPLFYQLKGTPQDPSWHAEGDVHIHTQMILDETYAIIDHEAAHLSDNQKFILILAAAFHDIAKPLVTAPIIKNGMERIGARGHEYAGGSYLTFRILDLGLDYPTARKILDLVTYHNQPKMMVRNGGHLGEWYRLYRRVDTQLLYYLELADMRGRCCDDKALQVSIVNEYRRLCEDVQVWHDAPLYRQWALETVDRFGHLDVARRNFFFSHLLWHFERGHINTFDEGIQKICPPPKRLEERQFGQLYIMCAPSGSGKSTWIKNHCPEAVHVSMDDIREEMTGNRRNQEFNEQVAQEARERTKAALRHGDTVVWDATTLRKDLRKQLMAIAHDHGALGSIVLIQKGLEEILEKNKTRRHHIPDDILMDQINIFQWPEIDEAHQHFVVGQNSLTIAESGTLAEFLR